MAIVKTSWQKYLSPDSEIPHDVFFVIKSGIDGDDSSNRIGAHKVLLAGASPVFTRMFFGPMKEEREEFEVEDTTYEMFNTMINYIYQPPGYHFFPSTHEDDDDDEEEYYGHAEGENNIRCPQKFFDLLNLAEYYQISSLKQDLSSKVLNTLDVRKENLILAATVAKKHQGLLPFDEISTKVLAKCLRFLLQRTRSRKAGDLWSQFWAVVNDSKESLKSRLAGTLPVADLRISFPNPLKYELDQVGRTSYENCLYLACSGIHVSCDFERVGNALIIVVKSDSNRLNFLRGQSGAPTLYKVKIEYTPTHPTTPHTWDANWSFSCTCPSYARSPSMCKHIGACLIVHFG